MFALIKMSTIILLLITSVLFLFFFTRLEQFSPWNSYAVENTKVKQDSLIKFASNLPTTIPPTNSFKLFSGKFVLTPLFISSLETFFPNYNFAPELKNLKISPDNRDFVFQVSGITKKSPQLVNLLVHIYLENPTKYLNTDNEFFIPPNAQGIDFEFKGVSNITEQLGGISNSIEPNSPFFTPHLRIVNNMFLLGAFNEPQAFKKRISFNPLP